MFDVRRIHDDVSPANQLAIREVQQILTEQIPGLRREEIDALPAKLTNPFQERFRMLLDVAFDARERVLGFALLSHDPDLQFCYLDYLASSTRTRGRGVGAALYERVRAQAKGLNAVGLFFECLPEEPALCRDPAVRRQNARRLRFYESLGARPIVHTAYETPVDPLHPDNVPHLMYDGLDWGLPLTPSFAQQVVRAILERKYGNHCSPEYVDLVVSSFRDDPIRVRDPRPAPRPAVRPARNGNHGTVVRPLAMTVSERHTLHHIRERGYVETPVRIKSIRDELTAGGLAEIRPTRDYPLEHILAVHDAEFVEYLRRACAGTPEGKTLYPYVFPIRNPARPPRELTVLAGYYCIDTFTPIHRHAFEAARNAVDCALTAADEVLAGRPVAYALVRPPGHHAERRVFGGFCYFNNAAVAAHHLSRHGRVALLDIDYHHGNGQQEIFYERDDVLTISLHGDPDFAYPYFTGFADETGVGAGLGFNRNMPLPEMQTGPEYRSALAEALAQIAAFRPAFLVVALGFDTAKGDPTGSWMLSATDFRENGLLLRDLKLPTLVVQEGGYRTRTLGTNARHFFSGLLAAPPGG